MRVLVTGGSGFIGTNLVESLLSDQEVLSIDLAPPKCHHHSGIHRSVDICDLEALLALYHEFVPEFVIHLAARTDLDGLSIDDYEANTVGVRNIVAANSSLGEAIPCFFASSRLVFAIDHRPANTFDYHPSTIYGKSKIMGEQIVVSEASNGGPWCLLRPTSIWGPWFGTPYGDFFRAISEGKFLKARGFDPLKSFGYVGNTVYQLRALMKHESERWDRKVFWLADYPPLRVNEWADLVAHAAGVNRARTTPVPVLKMIARVGDAAKALGVAKQPPLTSFRLRNLLTDMTYDTTETERLVGDLPFSVEEGVEATINWMVANEAARS